MCLGPDPARAPDGAGVESLAFSTPGPPSPAVLPARSGWQSPMARSPPKGAVSGRSPTLGKRTSGSKEGRGGRAGPGAPCLFRDRSLDGAAGRECPANKVHSFASDEPRSIAPAPGPAPACAHGRTGGENVTGGCCCLRRATCAPKGGPGCGKGTPCARRSGRTAPGPCACAPKSPRQVPQADVPRGGADGAGRAGARRLRARDGVRCGRGRRQAAASARTRTHDHARGMHARAPPGLSPRPWDSAGTNPPRGRRGGAATAAGVRGEGRGARGGGPRRSAPARARSLLRPAQVPPALRPGPPEVEPIGVDTHRPRRTPAPAPAAASAPDPRLRAPPRSSAPTSDPTPAPGPGLPRPPRAPEPHGPDPHPRSHAPPPGPRPPRPPRVSEPHSPYPHAQSYVSPRDPDPHAPPHRSQIPTPQIPKSRAGK